MHIVLIRWWTCLDVAYQCVLYILTGKSADPGGGGVLAEK